MKTNILMLSDSYKYSHYLQYPKGTQYVSSYIESRGGLFDKTVFFGLQMFIKEYLLTPFTLEDVMEAELYAKLHGVPFNTEGFLYILKEHGGLFPVEIKALPEGTVLAPSNALVQIINTDPVVPWVTSFIETPVLRAVWYPTTVATLSRDIKGSIMQRLEQTSDIPAETLIRDMMIFMLHDFGARGVSSYESALIGGSAHLVNFSGTDTFCSLRQIKELYGRDLPADYMPGFSVPAAEHSTQTPLGPEGEGDCMEQMIDVFGQDGPFSCVSDSYDLINAVRNIWGGRLKEKVKNSVRTVIRPDSGNPVEIVSETILALMDEFGYTVNDKGFKVLPEYVRVLQGDGINRQSIRDIMTRMVDNKLSIENIVFGMGGALLQQLDRDTLKFAMKASAMMINGEWVDVYKDPITDTGKRSKRGIQAVTKDSPRSAVRTVRQSSLGGRPDLLEVVYLNGELKRDQNFEEIRALAA